MKFVKGITVAVAALFILVTFSNAYAQSVNISSANPAEENFVEPYKQNPIFQNPKPMATFAQSLMKKQMEKQMENRWKRSLINIRPILLLFQILILLCYQK